MDLGLAFDDEDLSADKKTGTDDYHLPYNVKTCSPQWFESTSTSEEHGTDVANTELLQQKLKFSGDFHYHHKRYAKAAEQYEPLLELVPELTPSIRQDVRESLIRCYAYLGQTVESVLLAKELVSELSQEDEARHRQSLMLLSFVCEKAGNFHDYVLALERLCCLQPNFPQYWHKLGDGYSKLQGSDTVVDCPDLEEQAVEMLQVKQLTCYNRARVLFHSVMFKASYLVKTRNENMIRQLSDCIEAIPLTNQIKEEAQKFIQREVEIELSGSKSKEPIVEVPPTIDDAQTKTESMSMSFYERFCSWHNALKS